MSGLSSAGQGVRQYGAELIRSGSDRLEKLARFGHAAKGAVYLIVGALAVQAAFGSEPTPDGSRAAIDAIAGQPFGRVLLGITALGLLAYVVWRFVEAIKDPERRGSDVKGLAIRAGYVVSGIVYAALAFSAAAVALGAYSSGGGDGSRRAWTAWVMSFPLGQWLIAAAGIVLGIVGLVHFQQAYSASFMRDYNLSEMSAKTRTWAKRIGQFGLAARGVTFCLIAWFVAQAALNYDPSEVRGLGGALNELAAQPYGQALMAVVAAGLAAYGVFCFTEARWKSFKTA